MSTVFACIDTSYIYFLSIVIAFVFVEQACSYINIHPVKVTMASNNLNTIVILLCVFVELLTTVTLFRQFGVPSFAALDFTNIYKIRGEYATNSLGYALYPVCVKTINPFLFAIARYKKRKAAAFLVLLDQFVIYLWLAHKSILFSIVLLIIGGYLANKEMRILIFSRLMILGVALISILEGLNRNLIRGLPFYIYNAYSLMIRRALIAPATIKQYYYEFFVIERNPLAGFFGTIIAPVLTRLKIPYAYSSESFSLVIGRIYGNGSNLNTGLFGNELAHFGYIGIFVAALFLIVFLFCVKIGEEKNGKAITCGLAIYIIVSLSDSSSIAIISFSPMLAVALLFVFFDLKKYQNSSEIPLGRLIKRAKKNGRTERIQIL